LRKTGLNIRVPVRSAAFLHPDEPIRPVKVSIAVEAIHEVVDESLHDVFD
jgi:hypothetical protein